MQSAAASRETRHDQEVISHTPAHEDHVATAQPGVRLEILNSLFAPGNAQVERARYAPGSQHSLACHGTDQALTLPGYMQVSRLHSPLDSLHDLQVSWRDRERRRRLMPAKPRRNPAKRKQEKSQTGDAQPGGSLQEKQLLPCRQL